VLIQADAGPPFALQVARAGLARSGTLPGRGHHGSPILLLCNSCVAASLHAFAAADTLAPGVRDTALALGIVASFAFLQSVHYAVWLHAIPQEATRGEGTLTFRMSFRALVADFGWPMLALSTLLILAVPLAGLVAPLRAQATYLSLSAFHAYLELAALALIWVRGGEAGRASPSAGACC